MKKRLTMLALCIGFCLFLLFIYFQQSSIQKKALARGADSINNNLGEEPLKLIYEKRIEKSELDHMKTNLEIKRSLIEKELAKGPNYNIDPKDGTDFKEVFKDSLFIGDSITNGLAYYKHVNHSNVVADIGQDIRMTMKKKLDLIKSSNAKHIYIMLGMNDAVYIEDADKFVERYKDLIDTIRSLLPEAKLNIVSILPINHGDDKRLITLNERVSEFNQKLSEFSKERDIPFVDIRPFIEAHRDFYAKDGMHVSWEFYRYWLKFIQVNYMN